MSDIIKHPISELMRYVELLPTYITNIISFMSYEVNIGGENVTVLSLLLGGGIALYLIYQLTTWLLNIVT